MKLKYETHTSYSPDAKGFKEKKYIVPISTVNNYQETKEFFDSLFLNSKHVNDIEYVDIGKKSIIRAKFWRGAFNQIPLIFSFESDYTKIISTHQLLNSVLGCLSRSSSYFVVVKDDEITVDKKIEVE